MSLVHLRQQMDKTRTKLSLNLIERKNPFNRSEFNIDFG